MYPRTSGEELDFLTHFYSGLRVRVCLWPTYDYRVPRGRILVSRSEYSFRIGSLFILVTRPGVTHCSIIRKLHCCYLPLCCFSFYLV